MKLKIPDTERPPKRSGLLLALALGAAASGASGVASAGRDWADETQVAAALDHLQLPRPLGLAASWDPQLLQQSYAALAITLRADGRLLALAPDLDVLRDLRRGDASATFGEDPYLTGELGVAAVRGLQGCGTKPLVLAVAGHLAGPELPPAHPMAGSDLGPIPVAPRELREVFLAPFETVVLRTPLAGIELSDNQIDGMPSHANSALVRIVKHDWGFKGWVLGSQKGIDGLRTTYGLAASPAQALHLASQAGMDALPSGLGDLRQRVAPARSAAAAAPSLRASQEGVVLLKNDGTLPLTLGDATLVLRVSDASPAALARLTVPARKFVLLLSGTLPAPSAALTALTERASAVLAGFELGSKSAQVLDAALFGKFNPSGKLPLSIARNPGQLPMFYNAKPSAWRGYLFDTTQPLYPFGWGLSYTRFEIGAPKLARRAVNIGDRATLKVEVRNTGARAGDEVVQLYVHHQVASTTEPVKQLVGFARVSLAAGARKTLTFSVSPEQLSLWNEQMQRVEEPGDYELMSGANSAELQTTTLTVQKAAQP